MRRSIKGFFSGRSLFHLVMIFLQVAMVAFMFGHMYIFSQKDVAALHTLIDVRASLFSEKDQNRFDSNVFLNNVDLLSHATIVFGKMPNTPIINEKESPYIQCLQSGDEVCAKAKEKREVNFSTYYPKVNRWLTFVFKTQNRSPQWLDMFFILFECLFILYLVYYLLMYSAQLRDSIIEGLSGTIASMGDSSSGLKTPGATIAQDVVKDKLMVLSSASHDIKTPLTRIKLLMDTAEGKMPMRERVNGELDKIVHCLNHVEQYIQTGEMLNKKQLKPLQFNSFMDVAVLYWQENHPEVKYSPLNKQVNVYAQSKLLRRAMDNVMKNAIDYAESFHCSVLLRGSFVQVKIQDSGPGVKENQLDKIFQPFVKGNHQSGTGLGLSITKRIIEAHRGEVIAESMPNQGLLVTISLPLLSVEVS
jgi:signal transduction histidine kinase